MVSMVSRMVWQAFYGDYYPHMRGYQCGYSGIYSQLITLSIIIMVLWMYGLMPFEKWNFITCIPWVWWIMSWACWWKVDGFALFIEFQYKLCCYIVFPFAKQLARGAKFSRQFIVSSRLIGWWQEISNSQPGESQSPKIYRYLHNLLPPKFVAMKSKLFWIWQQ